MKIRKTLALLLTLLMALQSLALAEMSADVDIASFDIESAVTELDAFELDGGSGPDAAEPDDSADLPAPDDADADPLPGDEPPEASDPLLFEGGESDPIPVTNQTIWSGSTPYIVNKDVIINGRITVKGHVHLTLGDGATLMASAGITVSVGNSLTIDGTGALIAGPHCPTGCAGIGGDNDPGGTITITGGTVTAYGGQFGAGIGSGSGSNGAGGEIMITGGTVTAYGGDSSAGIGGGVYGAGSKIKIYGGQVTANGIYTSPGIGAGLGGEESTLQLDFLNAAEGDYLCATGYNCAATVTGYMKDEDNNIYTGTLTDDEKRALSGKKLVKYAPPTSVEYLNEHGGKNTCSDFILLKDQTEWSAGNWYVVDSNVTLAERVTVRDSANLILCDGAKLTAAKGISVPKDSMLTIYGQAGGAGALIAGADCPDNFAGIGGDNGPGGNITIVGGTVTANGGKSGVGIGGGSGHSFGWLSVYGGQITAIGGEGGAGIGGHPTGDAGGILRLDLSRAADDAWLYASSYDCDVGVIGYAADENGKRYTGELQNNEKEALMGQKLSKYILPGVEYLDESRASKICAEYTPVTNQTQWQGGWYVVDDDVLIRTRVTATGHVNLILCDGAKLKVEKGITVSRGSSLTVYGQTNGTGKLISGTRVDTYNAGIGGVNRDGYGEITINGGEVKATGGAFAPGIGSSDSRGQTVITVNGGKVTASGKSGGAGIGGGRLSLDLSNAAEDDYLCASSYDCPVKVTGSVKDESGNVYRETLSDGEKTAVKGKKLMKYTAPVGPDPGEPATAGGDVLIATMTAPEDQPDALMITWTTLKGMDGYDVFFKEYGSEDEASLAATTDGNSHTFTGLKPNTFYAAIVSAWTMQDGDKTYAPQPSLIVYCCTGNAAGKYTNPKAITAKKDAMTVKLGNSAKIKYTQTTYNKKKLLKGHEAPRFLTDEPGVATVDENGRVTAVGPGSCTIYAVAVNGLTAQVTINVDANPQSIKFTKFDKTVKVGETLALAEKVALKPADAVTSLTWESSKPDIASVDATGTVTAHTPGSAKITVKTGNGKKATVKITVKE